MGLVRKIEALFHKLVSHKNSDKNAYLMGNFGPIADELFGENLQVDGTLPAAIDGVFMRNGPNPQFQPAGGYHWFDGDGMVHAVCIQNGRAAYNNRYVHTSRYMQEKKVGAPLFMKIGDMAGASALLQFAWEGFKVVSRLTHIKDGVGTANTAFAYHAGKVLALYEADLPYQLRILCNGLVETIGRLQLGDYKHPFTAHPKICPKTGELFFFGYNMANHAVMVGVMDTKGHIRHTVKVKLPTPIMMHDCAITEEYVVLLDTNLEFHPHVMVKEGRLPFVFNKKRGARFGLLRRDATDAKSMQWFQIDIPVAIFHTVNAWQEGSIVKLYACAMRDFDLDLNKRPVKSDPSWLDYQPQLYEFILDTATGSVTWRVLNDALLEFPMIPAALLGQPTRYAYLSEIDEQMVGRFTGILKVDLTTGETVGRVSHGANRYGGEAVFVPERNAKSKDDGYLMTYVTDETEGRNYDTKLVIYSALTMTHVASVQLPRRVPYGMHAMHVNEQQLREHNAAMLQGAEL